VNEIYEPELTSSAVAGAHVLIIDDRVEQLCLLVETLRGHGLHLSVAFDGKQGYDSALTLVPDVILLEVIMPKMDGFTVARMLKSNPFTAHIPILFLTASTELGERLAGFQAGAVDYIVKPFSADEVFERINIHLRLAGALAANGDYLGAEGAVRKDSSEHNVLVRAAKKYILNKLAERTRLSELARALGVAERRLSSAFHHSLGVTVPEFIRQERMRTAQRLLAQTSLDIGTIAEEVGFSSAANFSTAFRDQVGTSPSAFRHQTYSPKGVFGSDILHS
jgi:DNA-binding response OmpR family regulator